jgi:alcohol/geraniol dehydrogenase (NADP+)
MGIKGYAAKGPKQPLEPFEYEPGPLGRHEVEVKVSHCGICHSDLAMIDNDWGFSAYPLVPGHEVIGTIASVGSDVEDVKVGQRVGVGWHCGSCGHCEWCGKGVESLCANERATIVHHHGGWAESVRCEAKFAMPIPDAIESSVAGPFMCAGSTVFTPMVRFGVKSTMRTAVVGIGGLGHLAVQFLAAFGCEVTAISSSHSKDDEARQMGATHFLATKGTDELKKAAGSFDFIISTVGADLPWDDYVAALRPQGRLVLVGIPESALKITPFPLLYEKSVSGGQCGGTTDTKAMLDFAARSGVRPIVESFKMAEVNKALDHVRAGKPRYRVVLEA